MSGRNCARQRQRRIISVQQLVGGKCPLVKRPCLADTRLFANTNGAATSQPCTLARDPSVDKTRRAIWLAYPSRACQSVVIVGLPSSLFISVSPSASIPIYLGNTCFPCASGYIHSTPAGFDTAAIAFVTALAVALRLIDHFTVLHSPL